MSKLLKSLSKSSVLWFPDEEEAHMVLVKYKDGRKIGTVVPLHKELKAGTLMGVLKLAGIEKDEFIEALNDP